MMKSHLGPEHSSTTNRIHSPSSPHWPSSTVREQAFLAMHSMHSLVRELRTCSERHLGQAHCNKPPRPQSYHNNHLVLVAASVHEKHCIPPSLRLKSTFWNSFPSYQAYTRDARDARDALSHTDTRQAPDFQTCVSCREPPEALAVPVLVLARHARSRTCISALHPVCNLHSPCSPIIDVPETQSGRALLPAFQEHGRVVLHRHLPGAWQRQSRCCQLCLSTKAAARIGQ